MKDISKKIYKFMIKNKIDKNQILNTLEDIYEDLAINMWETIAIESELFYNLKDVIWYNMEHVPNNGETIGVSDMRFLGCNFPHFIYACNNSDIISLENIPNLLIELNTINQQWNKDWSFVNLYTKSPNGWKGGEVPTKLIIHAYKEPPSNYGYNQYYNVLNSSGEKFKKFDLETALCCVNGKIGEYSNSKLLQNIIINLIKNCKNAIKNETDIKVILG